MTHRIPLAFGAALLAAGCAPTPTMPPAHVTPFTGTWTMDPDRSTFDPGPPFQRFTLTFRPDGTRELDLVGPDGHPVRGSLPWSDGREVAVAGMAGVTATSRTERDHLDDTWTQDGRVIERVHGVVSPDGQTLAFTVTGPGPGDRPYHNRLTFVRQTPFPTTP